MAVLCLSEVGVDPGMVVADHLIKHSRPQGFLSTDPGTCDCPLTEELEISKASCFAKDWTREYPWCLRT